MEDNSKTITIWVDADSCPSLVRNHAVKMGNKLGLRVVFVANKKIGCDVVAGPYEMTVCGSEKDAADNYIFENCKSGDLVITRDIIFAGRLVEKEICTINDRGTEFTKEMIKERLSISDFDRQLAEIGLVKHFHEGYDKKKFADFANSFDKVIHRLINLQVHQGMPSE